MTARNDITGDAIRSRDSAEYAKRYDAIEKVDLGTKPVFEVFFCTRCHIKVATSNKTCPCCELGDKLKELL